MFLGTEAELAWAFGTGLRTFHPGLYEDFLQSLPEPERADPLQSFYRRILHPDPKVHLPAAMAWHDTERILSEVAPPRSLWDRSPRTLSARIRPLSRRITFQTIVFWRPMPRFRGRIAFPGSPG